VAVGKHEAVAICPFWVGRMVAQVAVPFRKNDAPLASIYNRLVLPRDKLKISGKDSGDWRQLSLMVRG
jgi:hypothetical protein